MSLLGFDAIGRWALGQPPLAGSAALVTSAGALSETGKVTPFSVSILRTPGTLAFTPIAGNFSVKEAPTAGAFAWTGVAAPFTVSGATGVGSYVLAEIASVNFIGEVATPLGNFGAAGVAAIFKLNLTPLAGTCAEVGITTTLRRDFINWLPLLFPADYWGMETAADAAWSAASSAAASWTNSGAPPPAWSEIAPPSDTWAIDLAQAIPSPVSD